jgi:hypothetical protein
MDCRVKPGNDELQACQDPDLASLNPGRPLSTPHATPSFFCRLVDDVVYWKTSRLPG